MADDGRLGFWLITAAVVTLVGGPAAIFAWAGAYPLKAAALSAGYLFLWAAVALVVAIAKRVGPSWLDELARRVDYHVQERLSGFRKKYLEQVYFHCRDFDVKGLTTQGEFTLELQKVFVDLRVDPTPPQGIRSDPVAPLPEKLREGAHQIWDFIATGRNLAVVGPPGCGKTTLLKHIALTAAKRRKQREARKAPRLLPVLLYLRQHAEAILQDSKYPLEKAIEAGELADPLRENHQWPTGWFGQQLRRDRCIVLLDGLDEVAGDDARQAVVAWVQRQMAVFSRTLFLLTSRPGGYQKSPLGESMSWQCACSIGGKSSSLPGAGISPTRCALMGFKTKAL